MKITIIGAGAMGGAMAEGLLQSEKFIPSDITVSDHNQPVLDHFASKGASVTLDNQLACHGADIVCVVVKPWCVEKTLKGIKDALQESETRSSCCWCAISQHQGVVRQRWYHSNLLPRDAKHRHRL